MHFNASVEPIPQYLETVKEAYPKKTFRAIKQKMDAVVGHLQKVWPAKAEALQSMLMSADGGLVGNIMIDRFGVLQDLREFADDLGLRLIDEAGFSPDAHPFAHLMNQGDADGVFLPFKFKKPLSLRLPGRGKGYPFPVGSGVKLREELDLLNKHLKVERTFQLHSLPVFIEAGADDIDKMEQLYGLDQDSFWVKFGFVVLRQLNQTALDHKLPLIFHYD